MENKDISISEMKKMQMELFELHQKEWGNDMEPKSSKNHILYMIEELGEAISIIKKKGIDQIMNNPEVREKFITEMTDVQMYYIEILNRLQITSEEFANCYINKHNECMNRNYKEKWKKD